MATTIHGDPRLTEQDEDPMSLEDAVKHRLPGYTVDLFLEKGDITAAKAELERLLLEGIAAEESIEATPQFFDSLRENVRRKAESSRARKSV